MRIVASAPHFFVNDLDRSIRFYVDVLGFEEPKRWGEPPVFAMVHRDEFVVMLNQADPDYVKPNGVMDCWDAYFWCEGVENFYETVKTRADIVHGPEVRPEYGMKEIGIRDPDGYMLVFAEDVEEQAI